jgi:hypothetical protein
MPINIVQQWERDVLAEAEELHAFAEDMADLQGMRSLFTAGTRERMERGVSLDGESQSWKLFWDEAAKRFKRKFGYLPVAKARQLLAVQTVVKLIQERRKNDRQTP